MVVRSDRPIRATDHAEGGEAALAAYGDTPPTAEPPRFRPPTVWCSWYRYFEEATASDVMEAVRAIDDHGLAVDVVQVDDGGARAWARGWRPRPSASADARRGERVRAIGSQGRHLAGAGRGGRDHVARRAPDWLVGPAGRNWGQPRWPRPHVPGVRDLLGEALRGLVDLGVDYLKLDFLYAGAVPGRRHADVDEIAAYRGGLALVREAVGPDVYLVGCGAPLLPSVGLLDAMRVSPTRSTRAGRTGPRGCGG